MSIKNEVEIEVFAVGDTVYHRAHGKSSGVVQKIDDDNSEFHYLVDFVDGTHGWVSIASVASQPFPEKLKEDKKPTTSKDKK